MKPTTQNKELLVVEEGGTFSYHWALKGKAGSKIRENLC
jgi:hypothetical protein